MMQRTYTLIATLVIAWNNAATGNDLEPEVPIFAGGEPIDVQQLGEANPWVVDLDGDRKKDLLVGHSHRTTSASAQRTQLYLNVGTNHEPRFERLRYEPNARPSGYLSNAQSYAAPQHVDLDGDGQRDFVLADWPLEVRLLRGRAVGKFAAAETLIERNRLPIDGRHVGLHVIDWDGDGDFDFVIGGGMQDERLGHVCLIRNTGSAKQFKFDEPEPIHADGRPIVAPEYNAAPVVADWDADGKLDLVLGCGDGSVVWFRNTGSRETPTLSAAQTLVPPPAGLTQRGKQARPCVVDWNDDGRLDLVVGDYGSQFDKILSAEEGQWQQRARTKQAELLTEWAGVFKRYRDALAQLKAAPQDELLFKPEIDELRERLVSLNLLRDSWYQQEQLLQPGRQSHGRIWLFLRKAP
jgi:hypothetical protein